MPGDWTREEVEAVVADYLAMWFDERAGRPVNKTEHRRLLKPLLQNRSDGSVERKHQNISAILLELGIPAIDGYKPLGNYQRLLGEVVNDSLASDRGIRIVLLDELERPAVPAGQTVPALALVDAPPSRERRDRVRETQQPEVRAVKGVDYLALEARSMSLGLAGEELVLQFEREWLVSKGQERLAEQVAHVSRTQGDGLGFDILSFDSDGRERLLEVKTTRYGRYTPFFATRREVDVSDYRRDQYELCRIFRFGSEPQFYRVAGSIRTGFDLDPSQYVARIA
mgnify:CR=1 FL=1